MTTHDENAYKLAFDRATEMANRRPLPPVPGMGFADIDPRQLDMNQDATTNHDLAKQGATASAVGLTVIPAPKRSGRPRWVAATVTSLVLLLTVGGLVARFAPSNSVAESPSPNVTQSATNKPSPTTAKTSPTTAKTLPSEQSPCFNMPGISEDGPLPSDVNRIWVCGEGYDDKPLEGKNAAALMAKINAIPPTRDTTNSDCDAFKDKPVQIFFDSGGQHHGYAAECQWFGNISTREVGKLVMASMKSVHGAPAPQAGTTDDLCGMTNLRYGEFDQDKPLTKAVVCTDRGSVPLAVGRTVPEPAMTQLVRQSLIAAHLSIGDGSHGPSSAWTNSTPGIAIRVTNGEQTAVWYLVDRRLLMGAGVGLWATTMWDADSTTAQQLRDLATPDQPTTTYQTAKSTPVPLNTSPCAVSPALDNDKAFPATTDRIWLCASGWDTRPLVGAEAAAVLERIKAQKLAKAPTEQECIGTIPAVPVFFDSGSERLGYYLPSGCEPLHLVPQWVIYSEIANALMKSNGPPELSKVGSDLCASTDAPTSQLGWRLRLFRITAAVCSDATGKPLAQGRSFKVDEEGWPRSISTSPKAGPAHSEWITVRVSDGFMVETLYLIGDQLWGAGGTYAVKPDAKTLAEIRKAAGQ